MTFINLNVKITHQQAHNLLMEHKNHYLWHKEYKKWTEEDFENLLLGKQKKDANLINNPVPVIVILNDGTEKKYDSLKDVSEKFQLKQSTISNILAGRKGTKKFLSIEKL